MGDAAGDDDAKSVTSNTSRRSRRRDRDGKAAPSREASTESKQRCVRGSPDQRSKKVFCASVVASARHPHSRGDQAHFFAHIAAYLIALHQKAWSSTRLGSLFSLVFGSNASRRRAARGDQKPEGQDDEGGKPKVLSFEDQRAGKEKPKPGDDDEIQSGGDAHSCFRRTRPTSNVIITSFTCCFHANLRHK